MAVVYNMSMANITSPITEVDILDQVVEPANGDLSPELARALLGLRFNKEALDRINLLAEGNRLGSLSEAEAGLFEKYLRVGNFLNLVHAKARVSLSHSKAG